MATKKVQVHPGEARTIATYLDDRDAIVKMLTGAVTLVCAREGIPVASLSAVVGDELILEVPDADQPDRPESSTTGAGVVGTIPAAPNAESASESTPDGKNGHSSPVVDAPDAGKPADGGAVPSRGAFRHTEGV